MVLLLGFGDFLGFEALTLKWFLCNNVCEEFANYIFNSFIENWCMNLKIYAEVLSFLNNHTVTDVAYMMVSSQSWQQNIKIKPQHSFINSAVNNCLCWEFFWGGWGVAFIQDLHFRSEVWQLIYYSCCVEQSARFSETVIKQCLPHYDYMKLIFLFLCLYIYRMFKYIWVYSHIWSLNYSTYIIYIIYIYDL